MNQKLCPVCGAPVKFSHYHFEHTNLIFGESSKVYKCTNCDFVGIFRQIK